MDLRNALIQTSENRIWGMFNTREDTAKRLIRAAPDAPPAMLERLRFVYDRATKDLADLALKVLGENDPEAPARIINECEELRKKWEWLSDFLVDYGVWPPSVPSTDEVIESLRLNAPRALYRRSYAAFLGGAEANGARALPRAWAEAVSFTSAEAEDLVAATMAARAKPK